MSVLFHPYTDTPLDPCALCMTLDPEEWVGHAIPGTIHMDEVAQLVCVVHRRCLEDYLIDNDFCPTCDYIAELPPRSLPFRASLGNRFNQWMESWSDPSNYTAPFVYVSGAVGSLIGVGITILIRSSSYEEVSEDATCLLPIKNQMAVASVLVGTATAVLAVAKLRFAGPISDSSLIGFLTSRSVLNLFLRYS